MSSSNSKHTSFFDFFPIPKMLQVPACGIDISDTTIKLIEISRNRKTNKLLHFADKKIEPGIVESGEIKKPKELAKALAEIKRKYKITSAHASLPEERGYLFEAEFAKGKDQRLRDVIEFHLEENVPISVAEAVFDYDVIRVTPKGKIKVSVSVMPKEVVDRYSEAFHRAEIWLESLEIEAQSIARAVIPNDDTRPYLIADFGRNRTGVAIVNGGIVRFTSTIDIGGDMFRDIILNKLSSKNKKEAEELKEKKGLHQGDAATEAELREVAEKLKNEIIKHLNFWQSHGHQEENRIEHITLCGGNATVPGVKEYLSSELNLPVFVPNVWQNIFDINEELPPVRKGDSLSFATAIGLALKTIKD